MPKTRQQKEVTVQELSALLKTAKSLVFASYEKLPVKEIETLRRSAREQGVAYAVAKKTLLARAMRDAGYEVNPKSFAGNFATLLGLEDEVAPAKLVAAFAKEHDAMRIVGGVLEHQAMDAAAVVALAKLPSKHQSLGQLVGTLKAPISGFAKVLGGNLRGLVTALSAIKDAKA